MFSLVIFLSFLCALTFSAHIKKNYAYAVFPFTLFSTFCACFPKCWWLEFHVNQRGLKCHHWSTSSWLTAPPAANQPKRGSDITPTRLISCRCSEFTCTGENGLLSAGQHLSIEDTIICGHLSLLCVYLAIVNYKIFDLRLLSFDPLSLFAIHKKSAFILFYAIYFNLPFSIFKFMLIIFFIRDPQYFWRENYPI